MMLVRPQTASASDENQQHQQKTDEPLYVNNASQTSPPCPHPVVPASLRPPPPLHRVTPHRSHRDLDPSRRVAARITLGKLRGSTFDD